MAVPSVLVTGANGFVGRALCARLAAEGVGTRAAVRIGAQGKGLACPCIAVGDIGADTDWSAALRNIEVVVHLAARAHVMNDGAADVEAYRQVNVGGTEALARQALAANVRRFIFLSSIKVNGEERDAPGFNETDPPQPEDAYGVSKLEAELRLAAICAGSHTEPVVLRPPLIYGPGVKGNLAALVRAIDKGVPLPFALIDNRRSLAGVDNVVEAIRLCVDHPAAGGKTFLLSDERPVSSAELARAIAKALDRSARLVPVPTVLLRAAGTLFGRSAAVSRLTSSLVVDARLIREQLGWRPVSTFEAGILAMARSITAETARIPARSPR